MSAVADPATLSAPARRARATGRLAIDTEFMGEGRYRTLLCLIQLAVPEEPATDPIALVDPLAETATPSELGADPGRSGRADRHARRPPGHRAAAP